MPTERHFSYPVRTGRPCGARRIFSCRRIARAGHLAKGT
ncbi:hypothetical protein BSIN_3630 [Burkholderia singularis]|uniref:Uncharacterized protein n=1 Tax=Burkholderia singularis TaxID=1503053 RepID=A0A238H5K5_9BURK|nr:hypothetical protein BSIN_3630 [Burkholderia singularis]